MNHEDTKDTKEEDKTKTSHGGNTEAYGEDEEIGPQKAQKDTKGKDWKG